MLFQNDPFRELDNWFGTSARRPVGTSFMPMDAYRRGNDVWVHIDLPGVAADSLDIGVERNVLTVTAERGWQREEGDRAYITERQRGRFHRQVHLGDGLDSDDIEADYHDGVLTIRIPVAEKAQPKKVVIATDRPAIDIESAETVA